MDREHLVATSVAPPALKLACIMASLLTTLSPAPILIQMFQRGRDTGEIAWITLWTSTLSQSMWCTYYLFRPSDDMVAFWISAFAMVMFSGYLITHLSVSSYKDRPHRNRMFTTLIVVLFVWVSAFTQFIPKSKQAEYAGVCCNVMNLITLMAPLSKTREVFRTQSARSIPLLPALTSTVGACCWLVWGYLENDIYMAIPSVIAIVFGAIQLALIAVYGSGYAAKYT